VNRKRNQHMPLAPKHPPGRSTRKARAFEAEIGRLRAQGYTLEAIREALADIGVSVSRSTVQREAARHIRDSAGVHAATLLGSTSTTAALPVTPDDPPGPAEPSRGKLIAEAFIRGRITNPLIRNKEQP
jgi:hypothetical protein